LSRPDPGEPLPEGAVVVDVDRGLVVFEAGPKAGRADPGARRGAGGPVATEAVLGEAPLVGQAFEAELERALAAGRRGTLENNSAEPVL